MAQTELVSVATGDGQRLHGALVSPGGGATAAANWPQAVIALHGAGGNFYASPPFPHLVEPLLAHGAAVLRANNRGHDLVAGSGGGRLPQGAAYEIVDDCRRDVDAWRELLHKRGYERIALVGHSLGALKAVYFAAYGDAASLHSVVAISPPRLSHRRFLESERAEEYSQALADAQSLVADDRPGELMRIRFPVPLLISAASYVDKYGPAERYDLLRFAKLVRTPTRFTFGSRELEGSPAFAGLPDALTDALGASPCDVQIVAGANHNYDGVEQQLADLVVGWFRRPLANESAAPQDRFSP